MKKNEKYKTDEICRLEILLLILSCLILFYGRKERLWREKLTEKICEEQAAGTKQTENEAKTEVKTQPVEERKTVGQSPMIRVLLKNIPQDSYIHEQAVVASSGGLCIEGEAEGTYPAEAQVDLSAIVPENGKVRITSSEPGAEITLLSVERNQGIPAYEGALEVVRKNGGFQVINEVDLETYLKYVVPSEMPSDYPEEALKAQAVCARTYAVKQMEESRLSAYEADVDDTVSFQVYNNIARQPAADRAVDETKGMVIRYEGEVVSAYFFSTSCGYTSTDEVWEAAEASPFLKSISVSGKTVEAMAAGENDHTEPMTEEAFRQYIMGCDKQDYEKEEPWYRWHLTLPLEALQNRIDIEFPGVGKFQEAVIVRRSLGGAAEEMRIRGSNGEATICNEYRIREFLLPGTFPVICNNGKENTSTQLLPSAYIIIDPVYQGEVQTGVMIRGGGYGHGVGMSQNGAKHLAEAGMEWKEILQIFYRDVTFGT